jgi:hypothetical protein
MEQGSLQVQARWMSGADRCGRWTYRGLVAGAQQRDDRPCPSRWVPLPPEVGGGSRGIRRWTSRLLQRLEGAQKAGHVPASGRLGVRRAFEAGFGQEYECLSFYRYRDALAHLLSAADEDVHVLRLRLRPWSELHDHRALFAHGLDRANGIARPGSRTPKQCCSDDQQDDGLHVLPPHTNTRPVRAGSEPSSQWRRRPWALRIRSTRSAWRFPDAASPQDGGGVFGAAYRLTGQGPALSRSTG